ncbi:hypothetical protein BABINDRAFT_162382 [Babjeviella inositovora NRRL Y-12698]|uniref:Uncharacterized protein n=1 Tax=Babjeviella inositovora NRRL Y-12698 TaxID=984486 RepID=A0A1E3QLX1_9ASCO|nr:uncharacterized protein BABINDRAFT_162382 [Babjeviella inositovora NRRL Y-12698]ODQ78681.1 hypothetical protein BABINDRAFT_162382 [Babjeviella inositovora NRRL Y-12698]
MLKQENPSLELASSATLAQMPRRSRMPRHVAYNPRSDLSHKSLIDTLNQVDSP